MRLTPDQIAAFARTAIRGQDLSGGFPHALWAAMGAAGLFRIGLPGAQGGDDAGPAAIAEAEHALARFGGSPGLASAWGAHQMVARHFLAGFGSPAQRAAWLPRLASGAGTASVAISEARVGAHPKLLTTRARREAGGWRLDGAKSFITNGPVAELFVVLAITAEAEGRKRYSCFLVPQDTPGLARVPARDYPALHPAQHCGLAFAGCALPETALLGPEGEAYPRMALPFRDAEDAVAASGMAGTLAGAVDRLIAALPGDATPEQQAGLGRLLGLSAVLTGSARAVAAALEAGEIGRAGPQALMIGLRQLAEDLLPRLRAAAGPVALEPLLGAVEIGLTVARQPRAARAARLVRHGMAGAPC